MKISSLLIAGTVLLSVQGFANNPPSNTSSVEVSATPTKTPSVSSAVPLTQEEIQRAVVKIFTVASEPDLDEPWVSHLQRFSGSGCIIDGDKILTNAHVITDATYIEVLKNGETTRYEAKVLSVSHASDLALITVEDKKFFQDTRSLEIGKLPELRQEVSVYGFPQGGETLSITKGVVSRIEQQNYAHSRKSLLTVQIDAAINGGNSGGPAISNGKVIGLVMQSYFGAENMGYIIPPSVIHHYLEDMKDGHHDGYPILGILLQNLESRAMREMYGLNDDGYGVLINKVFPNAAVEGILKSGDVLMSIDGHKIFSNQKMELRPKEFVDFEYALNQHQLGDEVNLTILRDGQYREFHIPLNVDENELSLIKRRDPDKAPRYFIYGGLVFVPSILEHLDEIPSKYFYEYPNEEREELVLLKRVLSSSLTKGYTDETLNVITSVNGKRFKNFAEFVALVEEAKDKFVVFEDEDHSQIVLNRQAVLDQQKEILEQYNIKSDRSKMLTPPHGAREVD